MGKGHSSDPNRNTVIFANFTVQKTFPGIAAAQNSQLRKALPTMQCTQNSALHDSEQLCYESRER